MESTKLEEKMTTPSKAQAWLQANKENPSIKFLVDWITEDLQRLIENVENIEIIPNDPDKPTEVEFVVDFNDGTSASQRVQVED
jgi:hypothetical protein